MCIRTQWNRRKSLYMYTSRTRYPYAVQWKSVFLDAGHGQAQLPIRILPPPSIVLANFNANYVGVKRTHTHKEGDKWARAVINYHILDLVCRLRSPFFFFGPSGVNPSSGSLKDGRRWRLLLFSFLSLSFYFICNVLISCLSLSSFILFWRGECFCALFFFFFFSLLSQGDRMHWSPTVPPS